MADEKHADDKHAAKKAEENLTPTPTQAEMDEIMAKMAGAEVVKKPEVKEGADTHHPTPTSTPPVMSQEENDLAMAFAAPGEDMPEPKKKAKEEAEAKRRKEMEAEQSAGYKTRAASPAERK